MTTTSTSPERTDATGRRLQSSAVRGVATALAFLCLATVAMELVKPLGAEAGGKRPSTLGFVGSFALYGFFGCVALVSLGRLLRRVVMRPVDYWSEPS